MHVPAQHRAIRVVHRIGDAHSHPAVFFAARSCRHSLRTRLPTGKGNRRTRSQYTSTPASFLDFHDPPSYRICLASPISTNADSTIKKHHCSTQSIFRRLI
jgi:molybdopterin-guanine dinucleotide biosynthesis protein A